MNVAHIQQVSSSQLRISRHNTNNNTLHIHHLCITHHQRKCDSCNQENLLHLQEVGYIWRESELSKSQPQTCQINRELRIPALGLMPPWRTPGGSSTQWWHSSIFSSGHWRSLVRKYCNSNIFLWNFVILVYLLSGWSSQSYIESFIAIILLLSLDFWTVKNITGMTSGHTPLTRLNTVQVGSWRDWGGGTMWMMRASQSGTLSRALLKTKSSSLKQRFRFSGSGSSYFLLFGWDLMSVPFLSSFHQHCSQTCLLLTAFFTFKLKWVVLVIMSLVLSGSNLFGYLRWQIFNIHEPNTKYFKIPFTWDFIFI